MTHPSIEQVISALGKHTENPEVASLLDTLGISEKDIQQDPDLNDRKFWRNKNHEFELDLIDIGSLYEIPYHDIGEGPWVLTAVVYWSGINKGVTQSYGGALPYDIKFDMSRSEIKALISEPVFLEEKDVDVWQIDDFELILNYDLRSEKIRCVSLSLPPPPLSE